MNSPSRAGTGSHNPSDLGKFQSLAWSGTGKCQGPTTVWAEGCVEHALRAHLKRPEARRSRAARLRPRYGCSVSSAAQVDPATVHWIKGEKLSGHCLLDL